MGTRLTYKFVKREFEKRGYKLLLNNYINAQQKLEYICPKGHKHSITWGNFNIGCGCPYCVRDERRLSIEFIKAEFEKEDYKLLIEKYINSKQKLGYICPKGHKHNISWNNWKTGYRCPYCANQLVCDDNCLKTLFPELAKELHPTKNGDLTADKILPGSKKEVWWICNKGHVWQSNPNNRVNGSGCPYCYGHIKFTMEYVRSEFAKEGHRLLTIEYKNCEQRLEYICNKGHKTKMSFYNWCRSKNKCIVCRYVRQVGEGNPNYGNGDKMRGEKNPSWKGGISFEPYSLEFNKELKKLILKRDNYQCQNSDCWRTSKKLVPHHIDYNKENCDPFNLITLCRSCNARANANRKYWTDFYQGTMNKEYGYSYGQN